MPRYRADPLYPATELSPEAIERAMIRGRKLRARAFRDLAVSLYRRFAAPRRPYIDAKSLRNGVTAKAGRAG